MGSTSFRKITLAMDLSLASPGFAVLALAEGRYPIVLEVSSVKTDNKKSHGFRLNQIYNEITRLVKTYRPEHYVREKGFSRFPAVTMTLNKVVGISDLAIFTEVKDPKLVVDEIAVTSVKKLVTGNGKASKKDVEEAVIRRLQIDQADYFANDDESDAVACGLAFYIKHGLIMEGVDYYDGKN